MRRGKKDTYVGYMMFSKCCQGLDEPVPAIFGKLSGGRLQPQAGHHTAVKDSLPQLGVFSSGVFLMLQLFRCTQGIHETLEETVGAQGWILRVGY